MVDFLAELYDSGFKYHTADSYRSKISVFHQKTDGALVGEHPSASVLMKGIFKKNYYTLVILSFGT